MSISLIIQEEEHEQENMVNETPISMEISMENNCSMLYEKHRTEIKLTLLCNIKELLRICEYYGIKTLSKHKKEEIIKKICLFEKDEKNSEIVKERNIMWERMEELMKNPKMKKYIVWS